MVYPLRTAAQADNGASTGLSRRILQIEQHRFWLISGILDCRGYSAAKKDGGATSSMWLIIALAVSSGGLPDLVAFFCPGTKFEMFANLTYI